MCSLILTLPFIQAASVLGEMTDLDGWSVILDEVGQLRNFSVAENIHSRQLMLEMDNMLSLAVKAAPHVIMMQFRTAVQDVDHILDM